MWFNIYNDTYKPSINCSTVVILSPTTCQTWSPEMTMIWGGCDSTPNITRAAFCITNLRIAQILGHFMNDSHNRKLPQISAGFIIIHLSFSPSPFIIIDASKKIISVCFRAIGFLLCFYPTVSTWWGDVRLVLLPMGQHEGSALRAEQSTWYVHLAALWPVGQWKATKAPFQLVV